MSTDRVGIVWNPSKTSRESLQAAFDEAVTGQNAPEVSWFETSKDDPGRAAAQKALDAGSSLILAAGGDGTVRAVAEHLAESAADADLGILPLGTGNLLARNLEVPLNDAAAAFRRALGGSPQSIDIGWAEIALDGGSKRFAFAVMAGFGIDAHMIAETDDDLKNKAGWLAYVESLGRAVSVSEMIDIRLGIGDAEPAEAKAHTLIVGNCGMLQGGIILLPDADPADGELDLLVLSADGVVGWLDTLRNMAWDNGLKRLLARSDAADTAASSDTVTHARVTALTVELAEPRVFEVDGDDIGETTRIEISVQPGAIRVR